VLDAKKKASQISGEKHFIRESGDLSNLFG